MYVLNAIKNCHLFLNRLNVMMFVIFVMNKMLNVVFVVVKEVGAILVKYILQAVVSNTERVNVVEADWV